MNNGKSAPTEFVTFVDKIVVFYEDQDGMHCRWKVVPRAEIAYVDPERYQFFVHWSFDVYAHFLGNKVQQRLFSIFDRLIACTTKLGSHYRWEHQRLSLKASVSAIRKHAQKLFRRYYRGSFMSEKFLALLQSFISAIANNMALLARQKATPDNVLANIPEPNFIC